jgi:hypothetical protein
VGEPAGKTTQTDTSSNAQSGQVAGAAERKARARSPSPKTAYPSAFSQRRPLSRMNQTFGPDRTDPSNAIFMPREAGARSVRARLLLPCRCGTQLRRRLHACVRSRLSRKPATTDHSRSGGSNRRNISPYEAAIPFQSRFWNVWKVLSHRPIDAPAFGPVCATTSFQSTRDRRRCCDCCSAWRCSSPRPGKPSFSCSSNLGSGAGAGALCGTATVRLVAALGPIR